MSGFNLVISKDPTLSRCKNCGDITLHHSKSRSFFESVVRSVPCFGVYRCHECDWRGIKLEFTLGEGFWKKALFSLLLIIISAFVVRFILKAFLI